MQLCLHLHQDANEDQEVLWSCFWERCQVHQHGLSSIYGAWYGQFLQVISCHTPTIILWQDSKICFLCSRNPPPSYIGGAIGGSVADRLSTDTDALLQVPEDPWAKSRNLSKTTLYSSYLPKYFNKLFCSACHIMNTVLSSNKFCLKFVTVYFIWQYCFWSVDLHKIFRRRYKQLSSELFFFLSIQSFGW